MAFTITNGSTPASDGTADEVILFTLSARTYDISTNSSHFTSDAPFILPKGSQVWVRQITAPTSGSVFIEYLIGVGD
jgi:hypothetical protein